MNLLKNLKKANNGITLIALVITIIVLLILAGVSIAMLTGENGILTQANNASKQTEIAQAKERAKLDILEWRTNQIKNKQDATLDAATIKEILKNSPTRAQYIKGEPGDNSFTTISGYEILYSELDSSIESGGGNTEEKWTQPYEIAGFTHIDGEWNTGYVIQDDETGSEFVWIPVGATINGVTINLERVFYDDNLMTDEWAEKNFGEGVTISQVLQAFYGVTSKEELWESYSEGADYIADFQTSVAENGGFYIGRYEASYGDGGKVETVVSQKTRTSSSTALADTMLWNYISQTDAIAKCNEMYNGHESGIKSKLVNSYAWDTALKFINAVEGKNVDTDSNDWGNYNSSIANTGATSKAVACNIYDMAGNLYEWTTESYTTTNAVIRGGIYNNDGAFDPAGFRYSNSPTYTGNDVGFRPLLFK